MNCADLSSGPNGLPTSIQVNPSSAVAFIQKYAYTFLLLPSRFAVGLNGITGAAEIFKMQSLHSGREKSQFVTLHTFDTNKFGLKNWSLSVSLLE
jgi:hypothetical protein